MEASSSYIVLKFGGTSVATAVRWQTIISQMKRCQKDGFRPCVVVSAVTTITNRMSHCIDEALQNIKPSESGSAFQGVRDVHLNLINELGLPALANNDLNDIDDATFFKTGIQAIHTLLDDLEQLLNGVRLTREETDPCASPRIRARISAFGELMSSQIGLLAIRAAGIPCVRLDARRLLHSTETALQQDEDRYLESNVDPISNPTLFKNEVNKKCSEMGIQAAPHGYGANCAVITQGFIASTPRGATCLLGRGGSDTSAALFAALLQAERLEIWTDVHGLFTSDPRHVNNTRLIREVSYRVAQELASMGAKVLHPRCLIPAAWAGIPVEVHNTNDPNGPCSKIVSSDLAPTSLELDRQKQELQNATSEGNPSPALSPASRALQNASSTVPFPSLKLTAEDSHVMAVTCRSGQVLLNIKNMNMWGEAGFLSRVFAPFGELDVSVDLVATSQYAVSLTLDHIPGGVHGDVFARLLGRLNKLGAVSTREPCAVVSIVGERLRNALPELGAALEELRKREVHLMTQSSEDLNLSFVVDEGQAKDLVAGLHRRLFPESLEEYDAADSGNVIRFSSLGETWENLKRRMSSLEDKNGDTSGDTSGDSSGETSGDTSGNTSGDTSGDLSVQQSSAISTNEIKIKTEEISNNSSSFVSNASSNNEPWWKSSNAMSSLHRLATEDTSGRASHYVYDMHTVRQRCSQLTDALVTPKDDTSPSCLMGGLLYAMKANHHPELLRVISSHNSETMPFGLECVSIEEVRVARQVLGSKGTIQFTPNFCPVSEYAEAFRAGATVVVDNVDILRLYPEIFQGKSVGLRIDPHAHTVEENLKHGHHSHVRTSGGKQKFGLPVAEATAVTIEAQDVLNVTITGIHVHVGSGVMDPTVWLETAQKICTLILNTKQDARTDVFQNIEWIDIGGGLGIGMDLIALRDTLLPISKLLVNLKKSPVAMRMEPGRFVVADAGVLITQVTQIRKKAGRVFVGVATGMNSLIRPALYQAKHAIHNLSKLLEDTEGEDMLCDVVGPICESADVLGHGRMLPSTTTPGDVILIEHGGAYGHCMSSNYNLRVPAIEVTMDSSK